MINSKWPMQNVKMLKVVFGQVHRWAREGGEDIIICQVHEWAREGCDQDVSAAKFMSGREKVVTSQASQVHRWAREGRHEM